MHCPNAACKKEIPAERLFCQWCERYGPSVTLGFVEGRTLGKPLVGEQVVDRRTGRNPGFGKMFVREAPGKLISLSLSGLGFFRAIFDKDSRAWHDKIAGTVVLYRGEGPVAAMGPAETLAGRRGRRGMTSASAKRRWGGTGRHRQHLTAAMMVFAVVGCEALPTSVGGSRGRDATLQIVSVSDFIPGQTATLRGTLLSSITGLTVDGVPVTLGGSSDSVRTFVVPQLRKCEADGRRVRLIANGSLEFWPPLRVDNPLRLEPGESRLLDLESLACLQLPGGESHVLTALNTTIPPDRYAGDNLTTPVVPLLTLRTGPGAPPAALALSPTPSLPPSRLGHPHAELRARPPALVAGYSRVAEAPRPFDPAYATAQVGDTVRFPTVWRLESERAAMGAPCQRDRAAIYADTLRSYPVAIAAISGDVVVAVDLRLPGAAAYLSGPGQAFLEKAAAAASPQLLPAIRAVIDPDYTPLQGGGGRYYTIVTSRKVHNPADSRGWAAVAGDLLTDSPVATCPLASEMHATFFETESFPAGGATSTPPGFLGAVMVHEYAHQADIVTAVRRGLRRDWGGPEQLAVAAEEAAMRLTLGTAENANYGALGPDRVHDGGLLNVMWDRARGVGPLSLGSQYSVGALQYLFMRELVGETGLLPVADPLYMRIRREMQAGYRNASFHDKYDVFSRLSGRSVNELADMFALAMATDDLVGPEAARAHGLPQIRSWDATKIPGAQLPAGVVAGEAATITLSGGPHGYGAAYVWGAPGSTGVSFELVEAHPVPRIVRITRLR